MLGLITLSEPIPKSPIYIVPDQSVYRSGYHQGPLWEYFFPKDDHGLILTKEDSSVFLSIGNLETKVRAKHRFSQGTWDGGL